MQCNGEKVIDLSDKYNVKFLLKSPYFAYIISETGCLLYSTRSASAAAVICFQGSY